MPNFKPAPVFWLPPEQGETAIRPGNSHGPAPPPAAGPVTGRRPCTELEPDETISVRRVKDTALPTANVMLSSWIWGIVYTRSPGPRRTTLKRWIGRELRVAARLCNSLTVRRFAILVASLSLSGCQDNSKAYKPLVPAVANIVPREGRIQGGELITISGTNLSETTCVRFGGVDATDLVVEDESTVVCRTPRWEGALGWTEVLVLTAAGVATVPKGFIFVDPSLPQPVVQSLSPDNASIAGKTAITIVGQNLRDTVVVMFGGIDASDPVEASDSSVRCTVPPWPGNEESVDVTLTTTAGSIVVGDGLTYYVPQISSLASAVEQPGDLTLTWESSGPGDQIMVFRGSKPVATVAGDATRASLATDAVGILKYTVAMYVGSEKVSQDAVVVELGILKWDYGEIAIDGFLIYAAEAHQPFPSPLHYTYDAALRMELPLRDLYDAGIIEANKGYSFAVAAYAASFISDLSEPATCDYVVDLAEP
jgi:hypothetical protein